MIEIQCLGPPGVSVDGAEPPPELLWRKHLALLIYLARSPRGRTRDHLIGLLWPEKEEAKARHSLNEALRVIRRVVGDGLTTEGETVNLNRTVVRLDVDQPESLESGRTFLEGFGVPDAPAFEDWVAAEREKVRVAALERIVSAADEALACGDLPRAWEYAQRGVGLDSLHEPSVRALMSAHALQGTRSSALQVYDRLRAAMERDLGAAPAQQTRDLAERIRSERLVRGAPSGEAAAPDVVPLFGGGRTALAAALRTWRAAKGNRPSVVIVQGDSGTGKTRLCDELVARVRLEGGVASYARVLESDVDRDVWSALLRGGLVVPELGGVAPEVLASLAALDPDLATRFPAAKQASPAAVADPFLEAVIAVAESRAVILALDDAHRLVAPMIDRLGSLIARARSAPVCLVLTGLRGTAGAALDTVAQRVGRDMPGELLRMGPFANDDIDALVSWTFPEYDGEARQRLGRRVMVETAGNPFLAVEFVRAVRAGLKVAPDKTTTPWPSASRTLDETVPGDLPATVAAALRLKFAALSERGQALLKAVAVIGGDQPVPTLARAANVSVEEAERALDELEWQRWLVGDAHGYGFVTRLAQEVVLADQVTGGEKRRMRDRAQAPAD